MRYTIHSTRDAIKAALPFIQGRVLDAGGGPQAKYRSLIISKAEEYVNLDIKIGGQVTVAGDVMNMPFEKESFDTVICNQVLEHVPNPAAVISESFRILRSDGHFICTAPFWEPIHSDPGDFFRYTREGLEALCRNMGFRIIHSQSYGGSLAILLSIIKFKWFSPYNRSSRLSRRIFSIISSIISAADRLSIPKLIYSDIFVIAQK